MPNKILNCAVIGLGIGEEHARALLTHSSVKLSAVCDLDQKKIVDFLKKYELNFVLSKSFSEILLDDDIHLVSIASFDNDHFDQVMDSLRHGKHVFVEKPLCQTKDQLKEIYSLWKNSHLGLSSNLLLRKAPLYVWLENLINAGELGAIYAIDMDYLYGRIHKITEGWRSTVDHYSVMAGGGIHLVDLMMRFMNQKPSRVQSCGNNIVTQGTAFRYHDFQAATFHFEDEVMGRITANFGCMHRHQHVIRMFGTKATFIYDDMGARMHWNRNEDSHAELITLPPKPADKGSLLLAFVGDILEGDYEKNAKAEFDLMCAVMASDQAIAHHHCPIDITYLT
ncbi:MAG TPA: Gfo/Idh/MocA family oxidoreductase [Gammaproteobacteria bacterium]|nr:Gfo/Idh/MocA family oxidoreductase [Gammaproteobacteria bacterium]